MPEDTKEEAPAQAPVAEAAAPTTEEVPFEKLKPVARPDENELKEKIEEINVKITSLQSRLAAIKENLDSREQGRGDTPEVQMNKTRMSESKAEARRLAQERRNIYDQINAADALKKQQQELAQRLKAQLSFFSSEEIDRKIKVLEHQQQTSSMSVKEEKKILEEIKKLAANKPMIRQYDEARESLEGVREHHATLYAQLKAKAAELEVVKEEEEKWKQQLDAAKAKEDAKRSDIPSLFKERDAIRKEMSEHRDAIKKLRDDFNEKRREWQNYTKAVRDQKQKEWKERQAQRQKEYEEQKRLFEEEEAKRDPWEEEKMICEQLIVFCAKYLPKEEVKQEEKKEVEVPQGVKLMKKADLDDAGQYGGLIKKKSKRKGGAGPPVPGAPVAPKAVKLTHAPADLVIWSTLGFTAPASSEECPGLHEQLLAKREWLKTAPPKQKKKPKEEEPKEEEPKEEAAADGDFDIAAYKKQEAEELKAKQEAERKKAAEKDKLDAENLAKMQALEGAGKKVAGGMHKFDASEVDVHGGNATADDFMDAFGFGDEVPAGNGGSAAPPADGSNDMISIRAVSDSSVVVRLHL